MEEKLSVQMTEQALYDFMLYHTYSKFAGFLTNVLGAAVGFMGIIMMVMGKIGFRGFAFYLFAAAAFLIYTPLQLKLRAKKQLKQNPLYQQMAQYCFNETGIEKNQNEKADEVPWTQIEKVVATPKTIGFYYKADNAFIIPKEAFGEQFMPIMKIVSDHVPPQNIKLR